MKRFLAVCLCFVIILSCGTLLCGCSKEETQEENGAPFGDKYYNIIGSGRISFFFECVDPRGLRQRFKINTSSTYVLEALRETKMVSSKYGETITEVLDDAVDETTGSAWVLYENGKAVEGNYEELKITAGRLYSFVAEKK